MQQQHTVYYDQKRIDFLHFSKISEQAGKCEQVDHIDWEGFMSFINGNNLYLRCCSVHPARAFMQFSNFFFHHEAAGGVVKNSTGAFLFIFRNGRWDFPKGYVERGEKVVEAALREVKEECGLASLKVIHSLPATYHVYPLHDDQWALKKTYWFMMQAADDEKIAPQLSEGITLVEWRHLDNITDIRKNTYGNISQLIEIISDIKRSPEN